MADVKWIKLNVGMFDDEKIKLIEHMPESDTLLVIWLKLLSQAGKTNASGYIYLSENIPYTDEMLAAIFNRPLTTVRMALKTFRDFGMLDIDEHSFISISNWEKHQNIDGLEKIRKQTRERVAKHREEKMLKAPTVKKKEDVTLQSVTCNEGITLGNATELELELELELENKEIVENNLDCVSFVIDYLNEKTNKKFKSNSAATKKFISGRMREGHTLEDFKRVIDVKHKQWSNDPHFKNYLRPSTLFSPTNFENYLNENEEPKKRNSAKSVSPRAPQLDFAKGEE